MNLPTNHINLDSLKGKTIEEAKELIKGTKYNDVEAVITFDLALPIDPKNPVIQVILDDEGKIKEIKPSIFS